MSRLLWKLDRVTLAGRQRPRVDAASLEIAAGVTAVVGYSGAGKTSLLNLLVEFERPDSGKITSHLCNEGVAGSERSDGPAARVAGPSRWSDPATPRLPLYWVPQTDGLWPHLTALEHLRVVMSKEGGIFGRAAKPQATGEVAISERCRQILQEFDLEHVGNVRPDGLSQGERARLSVARALASGAAVLVLDEPLVHIDPARVGKYWDAVRRHCRETETSLVIATHSPELVLREAMYAVCLKEGRVVYAGNVTDLYDDPATPELAEFLGAANWLPPDDARRWLDDPQPDRSCYRPEQIAVVTDEGSPLVVQTARFAGSVEEVELLDERTGRRRSFFHRPAAGTLRAGDRVVIRDCREAAAINNERVAGSDQREGPAPSVSEASERCDQAASSLAKALLVIVFALLLSGCSSGSGEPQLNVRQITHWSLPPDGPTMPAPRAVHVACDGEVYVLDNAGRVLVYDSAGKLQRQWRMPESSVGKPEKICRFKDGRVAVADTHYHRVVFFDRIGNELGRLGTYGREPGEFIYPVAVVQDDAENFYVCEYGDNDRVQKFDVLGRFLLAFGSFGTEAGQFQRPSGIVWREGKVYVVDAFNNRIQVFSDTGEFLEVLGVHDPAAALEYPYDITANAAGELFVVEYTANRVSKFDLTGKLLGRFGTIGPGEGQFKTPWGLSVDGQSRVLVADTGNRRVVELKF